MELDIELFLCTIKRSAHVMKVFVRFVLVAVIGFEMSAKVIVHGTIQTCFWSIFAFFFSGTWQKGVF